MPHYLISYDLRKARNYQPLYDQLAAWGAVSPLESVWLAELVGPASTIRDMLGQLIDADDGLLVIQLAPGFQWGTKGVPAVANDWLRLRSP